MAEMRAGFGTSALGIPILFPRIQSPRYGTRAFEKKEGRVSDRIPEFARTRAVWGPMAMTRVGEVRRGLTTPAGTALAKKMQSRSPRFAASAKARTRSG